MSGFSLLMNFAAGCATGFTTAIHEKDGNGDCFARPDAASKVLETSVFGRRNNEIG